MSKQSQKYHLNLAGEFFVAAELHRLGIAAAVTYGNAKEADVVLLSKTGDKAVVVEVKCTSQPQWVVGGTVPIPSSKPWVFVYLPSEQIEAPHYYVMSQAELHSIVSPADTEYRRRFREKRGIEYGDRRGVVNLKRSQAEPYLNAWKTITSQIT